MSLFEKIVPETIESEDPSDLPKSSRSWKPGETLTVSYSPWMKLLALLSPLLILPFLQLFLQEGLFTLEILSFAALVFCFWLLADCISTQHFTFSADRILKTSLTGQRELPTRALLVHVKDQDISLFHGTHKNLRESMSIRRFFISRQDFADIMKYLADTYGAEPSTAGTVPLPETSPGVPKLALQEYEKAVTSYRMMAGSFVILALIAIFAVGLSEKSVGLFPALPPYPIRLAFIVIALGAFFLLRQWAATPLKSSTVRVQPVMTRLDRADGYAFRSAALSAGVASLGLLLFFFFGNTLDLYFFLLVGWLYFYDGYPRLSTWEQTALNAAEHEEVNAQAIPLPRRSLQVSLVLMGTLAVMSYGENNHYLYANRKDCLDDWGEKDCQEAPPHTTGSGGFHGSWHYYGPRYGSGGSPTHAVGFGTVSRGGFGSLASFHASFGG